MDNAPGFRALTGDRVLASHGIALDFGNIKNINKNPSAEKCNQVLELELLKVDPTSSPVSQLTLLKAIVSLNSRIRNHGLSAKEIVLCRDQVTHDLLQINGSALSKQQESTRNQNHPSSGKSKARCASPASLVYLKSEGDKFNPREQYIIISIAAGQAKIQKCNCGKFMSKIYTLSLNRLYPVIPASQQSDDSSSTFTEEELVADDTLDSDNTSLNEDEDVVAAENTLRRSGKPRSEPEWLRGSEWRRD